MCKSGTKIVFLKASEYTYMLCHPRVLSVAEVVQGWHGIVGGGEGQLVNTILNDLKYEKA